MIAPGGEDSKLSYLLRYLLVTSRAFHSMRDRGSHVCEAACTLAGELLSPDRAARPLPPETGGSFCEATIQALGQARNFVNSAFQAASSHHVRVQRRHQDLLCRQLRCVLPCQMCRRRSCLERRRSQRSSGLQAMRTARCSASWAASASIRNCCRSWVGSMRSHGARLVYIGTNYLTNYLTDYLTNQLYESNII